MTANPPSTTPATPIFIDLEASSLRDGFPIEIGWAIADGDSDSVLVKPTPDWITHLKWDPAAEQLHRISLEQLMRDGLPPVIVAARLNTLFAGKTVYSDAPPYDAGWLALLFSAASISQTFAVGTTRADTIIIREADRLGCSDLHFTEAERRVQALTRPKRHRAAADAQYWSMFWTYIHQPLPPGPPSFGSVRMKP